MLFLRGTGKLKIKTYQHHDRQCENCKDFNLTVKVFKDYYHFFFIPFIPAGVKSTSIQCKSCGSLIRSDSLAKEYESKTRIPFYLYTGVMLIGLFVLSLFAIRAWSQHENATYVSDPKVGDVYLMQGEQSVLSGYNFVRVKRVTGDTVIVYYNHVLYFNYTSKFDNKDYFDSNQEVVFTKPQLRQLLEKDSIETVYRHYDEGTGFNRIR